MCYDSLMQAYLFPSAFPDARPALDALKGTPFAILSNGSTKMLASAVRPQWSGTLFWRNHFQWIERRLTNRRPEFTHSGLKSCKFLHLRSFSSRRIHGTQSELKRLATKSCWCNRSQAHMEAGLLA
jgi:hypothetical protein